MRRFAAACLAACFFMMTACAGQEPEPSVPTRTQAETTAQTTTQSETSAAPASTAQETTAGRAAERGRVSVTVQRTQKAEKDETGDVLLNWDISQPSVDIDGDPAASAAVNEVLDQRSAALMQDGAQYVEWAKEDRQSGDSAEAWTPYGIWRYYGAGRVDSAVVSLNCTDVSSTGGAHPNSAMSGITFDVATGERLTLATLSDNEEALRSVVTGELKRQVSERGDELYDNATEAAETLLDEDDWYLSGDGLEVLCNEYIMAPRAAGVLKFTIPYTLLSGVLKPEYLQPVRDASAGEIRASFAETSKLTGFRIDRLTVDAGGVAVAFTATGLVRNLRISEAVWNESVTACSEGRLWYACSAMGPEDAAVVTTVIPEGMPNLVLAYSAPDSSERRYALSQSGKDGSLLLVDVSAPGT